MQIWWFHLLLHFPHLWLGLDTFICIPKHVFMNQEAWKIPKSILGNEIPMTPCSKLYTIDNASWWPLWILQIFSWKNARIKEYQKLNVLPINWGGDQFQDPISDCGAHWWQLWVLKAVWCYRRQGIAGTKQAPPVPLGWYLLPCFNMPDIWSLAGRMTGGSMDGVLKGSL